MFSGLDLLPSDPCTKSSKVGFQQHHPQKAKEWAEPTGKKGTYTKRGLEVRLGCRVHILDAKLNVQGVRENNGLFLLNAFAVVEAAHQLDVFKRVPGVLTHTSKNLGIGTLVMGAGSGICGRKWRAYGAGDNGGLVFVHRICRGGHDACKGFEEGQCAESVGQGDPEDTFTKATDPVTESSLVGVLIVVGYGGDAHEPFVRHRSDGRNIVFHREVDVACPAKLAQPTFPFPLHGRSSESLKDHILCMVISSSA